MTFDSQKFRPHLKNPRTGKRPRIAYSSIKKNKTEPTGELELFREIILERGSSSEISGTRIYSPTVSNMMHLLSKKQYPKFRLKKENIYIALVDEHREYDQGSHEYLRTLPEWKKVFDLREELLQEYKKLYG